MFAREIGLATTKRNSLSVSPARSAFFSVSADRNVLVFYDWLRLLPLGQHHAAALWLLVLERGIMTALSTNRRPAEHVA